MSLQALLDSTVAQCKQIKASGTLTLPELVKVATGILKEIYALKTITIEEKKAFLLMALQRGLDAAGPLQFVSHVDPAIVSEVEKQSLKMIVTAVFGIVDAFPQVFEGIESGLSYIRSFLSKYLPLCSQGPFPLPPRLGTDDSALIVEALKAAGPQPVAPAGSQPVAPATLEVRTVEPTPQAVAQEPQNVSPA
jgi:hypothetical protein